MGNWLEQKPTCFSGWVVHHLVNTGLKEFKGRLVSLTEKEAHVLNYAYALNGLPKRYRVSLSKEKL
jgi:hypothetical protein